VAFRNCFAVGRKPGNAHKGSWRFAIGEEGFHKVIRFLFAKYKNKNMSLGA
jgi:hypothetical protein